MSTSLLAGRQFANLASNASRRSFSTSSNLAAAAEVKRLGVIGAGQMVGIIKHTLASGKSIVSEADSRRSGARYRFGGSPESRGASDSG